jgi:hypothetical protein
VAPGLTPRGEASQSSTHHAVRVLLVRRLLVPDLGLVAVLLHEDAALVEAAQAVVRCGVALRCIPTITRVTPQAAAPSELSRCWANGSGVDVCAL